MIFWGRVSLTIGIGLGLCPSALLGWTGESPLPGTGGYVVDTTQRNDVVSFWQHVYRASEGYEARFSSGAYVHDVERRVNFVRALCGLPADTEFNTGATVLILDEDAYKPASNTTKAAAVLQSAMLISQTLQATGSLAGVSHNPQSNYPGFTNAAWNAASKGNLAFGFFGPGAVDSYFREDVDNLSNPNYTVGHRRWLLNPRSTDFATGDHPGKTPAQAAGNSNDPQGYAIYPTNSLYVFPKTTELATVAPKFTAYPAQGFFPAPLNSPYWSLSYPGAEFPVNTQIEMWDANGTPLTGVSVVSNIKGYGDNAVVWQVPPAAAVKLVSTDTKFTVKVSNFNLQGNPTPQSYTYTVTLINPDGLTDPLTLTGPANPFAVASTDYSFTRPAFSDAVEAGFFKLIPGPIAEGAEGPPVSVIDGTSSAPLFSSTPDFFKSGTKAFRLTFANRYDPVAGGVKDQSFEINRDLVPTTGASMTFQYKRGLMTTSSALYVEASTNGGLTWSHLRDPIVGNGTNAADKDGFKSVTVSLPTSGIARVRFRLSYLGGSVGLYDHEGYSTFQTGVFIDDISITNCSWLEQKGSVVAAPDIDKIPFNSGTAGQSLVIGDEWIMRLRAKFGTRWFPYGPMKTVTPAGAYLPSGAAAPPIAGATYQFTPVSTPGSYQLEVARIEDTPTEGAESGALQVTADVGNYLWLNGTYVQSGSFAFRLGVSSRDDTLDTITLNRTFVPTSTSKLEFFSQRRRMSATNYLHAEVSNDNGLTWTSVGSQPGGGTLLNLMDLTMKPQSYSLAAYAGQTIRIRFAFRNDDRTTILAGLTGANPLASGVWIDDIKVTDVADPISLTTLPGTATSFRLDATSAGETLIPGGRYRLRLRSVISGVPGGWGEPLIVIPTATPLTGYEAWLAYDYPTLADVPFEFDSDGDGIPNGVEYAFGSDPLVRAAAACDTMLIEGGLLKISRPLSSPSPGVVYAAETSEDLITWTSVGVTVTTTGGQAVASVVAGSGSRFLRWKISKL
jgi:hypothetical protein